MGGREQLLASGSDGMIAVGNCDVAVGIRGCSPVSPVAEQQSLVYGH